ncbi:hypothetical protein [Empedobacter sp. UBA7494]|uniref:hypothetical protein n=1 Tax=Empedobacter sp. UBA7494 TaxID=1946450 RepID=UPI0025BFA67E|nr:hypothetical protein [Empedobacter sp. UBA7494]
MKKTYLTVAFFTLLTSISFISCQDDINSSDIENKKNTLSKVDLGVDNNKLNKGLDNRQYAVKKNEGLIATYQSPAGVHERKLNW